MTKERRKEGKKTPGKEGINQERTEITFKDFIQTKRHFMNKINKTVAKLKRITGLQ